jgi:type IV pilus assembly protein PilM
MLITGIDIGGESIKIAQVRERGGRCEIVRAVRSSLGEAARLDPGEAKDRLVAARLAELLSAERIDARIPVTGLTGRGTLLRYVPVPPLPMWKLHAFMKYEAQEQGGEEASGFDYRLLDLPPGMTDSLVALIGTAQESVIKERETVLASAGVRDPDFDLHPLALAAAYGFGHGGSPDETVVVADVGAENVSIILARGSQLYFARTQAGAGRRFTESVARELGLDFTEAERVKREADLGGESPAPAPEVSEASSEPLAVAPESGLPREDAGKVADNDAPVSSLTADKQERLLQVLQREAGQLAAAVLNSLAYFRSQIKAKELKVDKLVLAGGGSQLKGLEGFLSRRLRLPVERLAPWRGLVMALPERDRNASAGDADAFAVAVGLALGRAVPGAPAFSLRPESVKAQRRFVDHTIYYAAAAALAAAALLVSAVMSVRALWVTQDNRDAMNAAIAAGAVKKKEIDDLKVTLAKLDKREDALLTKIESGNGLFDTLNNLKAWTDDVQFPKVCLLELTTRTPPAEAGKVGPLDEEEAKDPNSPWLNDGRLFLRVIIKAKDISEAQTISNKYYDWLAAKGKDFFKPGSLHTFKTPDLMTKENAAKDPKAPPPKKDAGDRLFESVMVFNLAPDVRRQRTRHVNF